MSNNIPTLGQIEKYYAALQTLLVRDGDVYAEQNTSLTIDEKAAIHFAIANIDAPFVRVYCPKCGEWNAKRLPGRQLVPGMEVNWICPECGLRTETLEMECRYIDNDDIQEE